MSTSLFEQLHMLRSIALMTLWVALACVCATVSSAQDTPRVPQPNPYLADTPFPIFHANAWASATVAHRGPEASDRVDVQFIETMGPSSWIHFGPRYADDSRPIWGGTMNSVYKAVSRGHAFRKVDEIQLQGKSISDSFVLNDGVYVTCDRERRRILMFADVNPGDPDSRITIVREFALPDATPGKFAHMSPTYDGWIVWLTTENVFGAVRMDFSEWVSYTPDKIANEVWHHNSFPIDESGNLFVVTTAKMVSLNFRGGRFTERWRSTYDFAGTGGRQPGFRRELLRTITGIGGTGSGTTPTIVQVEGQPRMVAIIDGQEPNHFLIYWADEIPTNWRAIPGFDRRLAGRIALPHSTPAGPGFSQENSPVGYGNEFFTAQWNGFAPELRTVFGAQKIRWDPVARSLAIAWTNPDVAMNGVPTLSLGSNLVYSSGPKDGSAWFYGLDWQTGETKLRVRLPQYRAMIDQGNQTIIDDDRSAYFATRRGLVRIRAN